MRASKFFIDRSTLLHLRIPFSIFLLPVFCFALATEGRPDWWRFLLTFVSLHLFLYPASNGYNSWFDRDEGSIGGLKRPPKIHNNLYYTSLAFDVLALLTGAALGWSYVLMLLVYGLVSKAYSHRAIRLKKRPLVSWLAAAIFQGGFTYFMAREGLYGETGFDVTDPLHQMAAIISTVMIGGFYPLTQVYQHEEDARRGDMTLSRLLGIKGTFIFALASLAVAGVLFAMLFHYWYPRRVLFSFFSFQMPTVIFFLWWMRRVYRDRREASFENAMRMNLVSSLSTTMFFVVWYLARQWL